MMESVAVRGGVEGARSEAVARVIAARFPSQQDQGDTLIRAVVALGRGEPLTTQMRRVLRHAGLLEGDERLPPAELLGEDSILRRLVVLLASRYRLSVPLTELAPGIAPEPPPAALLEPQRTLEPLVPMVSEIVSLGEVEAEAPALERALEQARGGQIMEAAQAAIEALRSGGERWSPLDHQAAGAIFAAAVIRSIGGNDMSSAATERGALWLEAAAERFEHAGMLGEAAQALTQGGALLGVVMRYNAAERLQVRALELARQSGDERVLIACLSNLGDTWAAMGKASQARQLYEEALYPALRLGERFYEANLRIGLAKLALGQGQHLEAEQGLFQALAIHQSTQSLLGEVVARSALGHLYSTKGRWAESITTGKAGGL